MLNKLKESDDDGGEIILQETIKSRKKLCLKRDLTNIIWMGQKL